MGLRSGWDGRVLRKPCEHTQRPAADGINSLSSFSYIHTLDAGEKKSRCSRFLFFRLSQQKRGETNVELNSLHSINSQTDLLQLVSREGRRSIRAEKGGKRRSSAANKINQRTAAVPPIFPSSSSIAFRFHFPRKHTVPRDFDWSF